MAGRPAIPAPGDLQPHDDFEGLLAEVWHQERLDKTIRRLDAAIDRDESLARSRAEKAQAAARKPTSSRRPRSGGRDRKADPGVRRPRKRKDDEAGAHARASHIAGIITLAYAGLALAVVGSIFTVVMKLVRLLA